MGFLGLSRERGQLAKWRAELEAHPRPHGIAELARRCLAIGDPDGAEEVLRLGESLFPSSSEIRRVRAMMLADASEERLREAKERVRSRPSVVSFLELADGYRAAGKIDQCAATLRELLDSFGDNAIALSQLGEIRLARYRDSLAATDGRAAASLLTRAVDADPEAFHARELLAEQYYLIGCWRLACEQVDRILERFPTDERSSALKSALAEKTLGLDDVDSQLTWVEENMEFAGRLPWTVGAEQQSAGDPLTAPDEEIERLSADDTFTRVALTAGGGCYGSGDEYQQVADSAQQIKTAFERAARGMELGLPTGLIIEGEGGAMIVELKAGACLAATTTSTSRLERASLQMRDALERVVRA